MLSGDPRQKLRKLGGEAEDLYYEQEYEKALLKVNMALPLAEKIAQEEPASLGALLNLKSGILRSMGQDAEALKAMTASIELLERSVEEPDFDFGGALNNVGQLTAEILGTEAALAWFERALANKLGALAKVDRDSVMDFIEGMSDEMANSIGLTYLELAEAYKKIDDNAKLNKLIDEAVPFVTVKTGAGVQLSFANMLMDLGQDRLALGMLESAVGRFEEALREKANEFAAFNPDAMLLELYKKEYKESGRAPAEFIEMTARRERLRERLGDGQARLATIPELAETVDRVNEDDPEAMLQVHFELGVELHLLGQESGERRALERARTHYEEARRLAVEEFDGDHPVMGLIRSNMEELERGMNKAGE